MKVKHTKDIESPIYSDALKIRDIIFIKGQGVPRSIEVDAHEAECIHFVLYDKKNQAAGTVRLLPNDDKSQVTLQRMAVLEVYQGQGLGRQLIEAAQDYAKEHGFKTITLHAQLTALNFYLKQGYQKVGQPFIEADMEHVTVEKKLSPNKA